MSLLGRSAIFARWIIWCSGHLRPWRIPHYLVDFFCRPGCVRLRPPESFARCHDGNRRREKQSQELLACRKHRPVTIVAAVLGEACPSQSDGSGRPRMPPAYCCRGLQQNMHFSLPRSQELMHELKSEQSKPGSTERHELVQTSSACTSEAWGIGTRKRTATPRSNRVRSINVIFIGFFSSCVCLDAWFRCYQISSGVLSLVAPFQAAALHPRSEMRLTRLDS